MKITEGAALKTETFKGKNKQDLDKKIWDWKLVHGGFRVKTTHPMENLPVDLNGPKGKGAKMIPADLVSIRLDYEGSN